MAGLYLILGSSSRERAELATRRLTFFDESVEVIVEPQFTAAWVGHDDPKLFGPAHDPQTGVRVFTSGRVSCEESQWRRAEDLTQYNGGLSNRLLLNEYLNRGTAGVERHNGPAALLIWDPRVTRLHLFTDHFGYHPLFLYSPENVDRAIIATFPDAIATDPEVNLTRDPVSAAEFLSAWRVTPPHTYYNEVKYAGAASHWCWDFEKRTVKQRFYWQPFQDNPFPNIDAAAEELALAVQQAVRIRTLPRLGPITCYTSGGMDSRAILFSSADPKLVTALNLYDIPNNEAEVARLLAEASGSRYHGFARDNDYYPRWLSPGVKISGAMWSHEDNHFLGTRVEVEKLGARTVMTACTADWLLKGYGLEKTYQRILGRNLPLKKFTDHRVNGFLPNYPRRVQGPLADQVGQRLHEWFAGTPEKLVSDEDRLVVEDRRVRPACYAVSVSGQIMYRIFPYDTFLADRQIADCYSRSRAEWKLNADLWAKAVQRICRAGGEIKDANFGWRIGSSNSSKLISFGKGWVSRRLNKARFKPDDLANEGSWPNLGWYVRHSTTLRQLWFDVPQATRKAVADAWGEDPWAKPFESWARCPNDLFRILTLATHMDTVKSISL